jgi:hypothetical protein
MWFAAAAAATTTTTTTNNNNSSNNNTLFPLCRVFTLTFLKQTMSLGNTMLQLFCRDSYTVYQYPLLCYNHDGPSDLTHVEINLY